MHSLRKEASELQSVVSTLAQEQDRLATGKVALDRERTAAEATAKDAEDARQRAVEAARQTEEALQSLTEHYKEEQRRRDEILRDISDYEIKRQSLMHEIAALTERLAGLHTKDGDSTDDPYIDLFTPPRCLG